MDNSHPGIVTQPTHTISMTDRVRRSMSRFVTREGVSLEAIRAAALDLFGVAYSLQEIRSALTYLIEETDQVRQDGSRYFWHETDTGDDPYGPARTPRPPQRPWKYFVAYTTSPTGGAAANIGYGCSEQITTMDQIARIEYELRTHHGKPGAVVIGWSLLSGPAAAGVTVHWDTDDRARITAGGRLVAELTYDEHGTAGMTAALAVVDELAHRFGFAVTVEGTPGV